MCSGRVVVVVVVEVVVDRRLKLCPHYYDILSAVKRNTDTGYSYVVVPLSNYIQIACMPALHLAALNMSQ